MIPQSKKQIYRMFCIICTSYTLEVASKTIDDLKSGVKKLVILLRLGGYLVILLDEDESYYMIGGTKMPVLPVSLDQLKEAVHGGSRMYCASM